MLRHGFASQLDKYDCFGAGGNVTPRDDKGDWGDDEIERRDTMQDVGSGDCDS